MVIASKGSPTVLFSAMTLAFSTNCSYMDSSTNVLDPAQQFWPWLFMMAPWAHVTASSTETVHSARDTHAVALSFQVSLGNCTVSSHCRQGQSCRPLFSSLSWKLQCLVTAGKDNLIALSFQVSLGNCTVSSHCRQGQSYRPLFSSLSRKLHSV